MSTQSSKNTVSHTQSHSHVYSSQHYLTPVIFFPSGISLFITHHIIPSCATCQVIRYSPLSQPHQTPRVLLHSFRLTPTLSIFSKMSSCSCNNPKLQRSLEHHSNRFTQGGVGITIVCANVSPNGICKTCLNFKCLCLRQRKTQQVSCRFAD